MIKNICTVILLLLSVLPAAGQNRVKVKISGNVITADGAPAEYITVSLKNTVFGGMSDGDGNFEFAAPGRIYDGRPIRNRPPQGVSGHHRNRSGKRIPEHRSQGRYQPVGGGGRHRTVLAAIHENSLYKVRSVNSDQIRQRHPWMYSRFSTPKSASASRTTWRSEKRTSS